MQMLFLLILFCLFLLILSEPLYIRIEKENDTTLALHFVFFSFLFIKRRNESKQNNTPTKQKSKTKKKISYRSYLSAWVKLRKRVKIKIDALYFPLITSPYTQALLCGIFPALLEGERAFSGYDNTSFALHIETTLPDCLILYWKALQNEKKKEGIRDGRR